MNLSIYDMILKIAELGSVAQTAEYYNYSPSRISQVLKSTEEELGVVLFYRGKGGLSPTMECQALLPALRALLASEKCFREQLSLVRKAEAGTIRIGSFTSLSCHWLPERLRAFGTLHPQIQFELKLGDWRQITEWVRSGVVDLGLITDPGEPDLMFLPLMEDAFAVILPEEHPLAGRDTLAFKDLARERFIFLEPEDNAAVEEAMRKAGVQPRVQYRVKDDYTIMALVESWLGISILPRLVLNRSPYRIRVVELAPACVRETGLVLQREGHVAPATKRLVEFWRNNVSDDGNAEPFGCPKDQPTNVPITPLQFLA